MTYSQFKRFIGAKYAILPLQKVLMHIVSWLINLMNIRNISVNEQELKKNRLS